MNRNMKAITWGMQVRGLDSGPWRLLMVLCSYVGKKGYEVWPSYNTMAERAETSRASAKRFVALLIERGLIEQAGTKWRENGGRSVNVYRIKVGEIDVDDVGPDEEDDFTEASDPRVKLNRGGSHSCDPGARVTADPCREPLIEGTSIPEDSPLFLTEETPSQDLLGDLVPSDPRSVDLVDYVQAEWSKLAERYPRIQNPRVISEARKKKIRARAKDVAGRSGGALTAHDVWDQIFAAIAASAFLRGEAPPTRHYPDPFSLSIDYITRPAIFLQTLERYTIDAERNQHTHSADGRRYGPAEQAMREVLAGMGLDQQ